MWVEKGWVETKSGKERKRERYRERERERERERLLQHSPHTFGMMKDLMRQDENVVTVTRRVSLIGEGH